MTDFTLYIGNKNYSSWSFRPWLAMTEAGIDFDEVLVPFNDDAGNPDFAEFSPTVKVPVLKHGDLTVWESLAIMEYIADLFPDVGLWPADTAQRAVARAVSHEMHGGFGALRSECPMNMRRPPGAIAVSDAVHQDVARIERMWAACLDRSGGPFLFGAFTNADAMYAPVVNRLTIYELSDSEAVTRYRAAMTGLKGWQAWEQAGRDEPWVVPADEA